MIIYGIKKLRPGTLRPVSGTEKAQGGCSQEGEMGGVGKEAGCWSDALFPWRLPGALAGLSQGRYRLYLYFRNALHGGWAGKPATQHLKRVRDETRQGHP